MSIWKSYLPLRWWNLLSHCYNATFWLLIFAGKVTDIRDNLTDEERMLMQMNKEKRAKFLAKKAASTGTAWTCPQKKKILNPDVLGTFYILSSWMRSTLRRANCSHWRVCRRTTALTRWEESHTCTDASTGTCNYRCVVESMFAAPRLRHRAGSPRGGAVGG